jgi:serine phosphatase RsbU (regulator of sigma subunit)
VRDAARGNTLASAVFAARTRLRYFADHYQLNDWPLMGTGDILLLHTDGLSKHRRDEEVYFPLRAERVVRQRKDRSARDIYEAIVDDVLEFGAPSDDVSLVVIKRS